MIVINFKNYVQGDRVLELAKMIERHMVHAVVAVPAPYIERVAAKTALNVYSQHAIAIDERSTGHLGAESIRSAGACGTLLNHSEHPITFEQIKKALAQCKSAGLAVIVCVSSVKEAIKIAALKPEMIAYEDPKLVSSGKSITQYDAHQVEKFVQAMKGKPIVPLCGAGISSVKDVDAAYKLGCKGVIISSAIAKSKTAERFMRELAAWNL